MSGRSPEDERKRQEDIEAKRLVGEDRYLHWVDQDGDVWFGEGWPDDWDVDYAKEYEKRQQRNEGSE